MLSLFSRKDGKDLFRHIICFFNTYVDLKVHVGIVHHKDRQGSNMRPGDFFLWVQFFGGAKDLAKDFTMRPPAKDKHGVRESIVLFAKNGRLQIKEFRSTATCIILHTMEERQKDATEFFPRLCEPGVCPRQVTTAGYRTRQSPCKHREADGVTVLFRWQLSIHFEDWFSHFSRSSTLQHANDMFSQL